MHVCRKQKPFQLFRFYTEFASEVVFRMLYTLFNCKFSISSFNLKLFMLNLERASERLTCEFIYSNSTKYLLWNQMTSFSEWFAWIRSKSQQAFNRTVNRRNQESNWHWRKISFGNQYVLIPLYNVMFNLSLKKTKKKQSVFVYLFFLVSKTYLHSHPFSNSRIFSDSLNFKMKARNSVCGALVSEILATLSIWFNKSHWNFLLFSSTRVINSKD